MNGRFESRKINLIKSTVATAIGRADAVVKLQDTIYVFEFKVDGTGNRLNVAQQHQKCC